MNIDRAELLQRLGDEDVLVVDCRTADEWDSVAVHIPGALHIAVLELVEIAHELPDDELIVLYGWAADGLDVQRAGQALRLRGRLAVGLQGGLRAWLAAGYPIERHGPKGAHSPRAR